MATIWGSRTARHATILLALTYFPCVSIQAQQDSSSQSSSKPSPNPDQANEDNLGVKVQESGTVPQPAFLASSAPQVQQVGAAGNLLENISPLRWGPVYVGSAQYAQIFDRGTVFSGQGAFQNAASLFSSTVVFDKNFRTSRIALQYVPRIVILNGHVQNDFANQDASLDTAFILSPRWSMNIGDHFTYLRSSNAFGALYLDANAVSGTTLQKSFLQGPITWLSNSVAVNFSYMIGPRARLSFAPDYVYSTTSGSTVATGNQTAQQYGARFGIVYDLSPRSSIQGYYSAQNSLYQGTFANTLYQTFSLGYSRQFGVGWSLTSTFGASTANFASGREWTATGSFSIVKAFQRSTVALALSRGHDLTGYITNNYTDRVDVTYRRMFGRRWGVRGGLGYERNISGSLATSTSTSKAEGIWGKYATGDISYLVRPSVSLFADYVKVWQRGDNIQIFTGNRDYIEFGIRWSPTPDRR
jgi:hypothetical protein